MRLRLPLGRTLLVLLFFLFALIALLPLRIAVGAFGFAERGLTARAATGSVWLGALQEAQVGPVALGDVKARLNLLPLLLGRARLSLSSPDANRPFEAATIVSRHGFGFEDVSGRLRLGPLASPMPLSTVDLQDVSVRFASGRCTHAEGRVRAAAAGEVAGGSFAATLSGNARCAGDALLLPLASQSGMEQVNLRLFADGRYTVELLVRPADAAARDRLIAAGFRPAGRAFGIRLDGRF
jgi:general secretion pathway protein N